MHEAQEKQSQQSSQEVWQPVGEAQGDGLNHNFGKESKIEEEQFPQQSCFPRLQIQNRLYGPGCVPLIIPPVIWQILSTEGKGFC